MTGAPTVITIDGQQFTLTAVWEEDAKGNKTFQGYMLYPLSKKPPTAPNKEDSTQ